MKDGHLLVSRLKKEDVSMTLRCGKRKWKKYYIE